jgi:hypothetical protein
LASRFQNFIHTDSLGNLGHVGARKTRIFASASPECRDRTPLHLISERRKNGRGIPVRNGSHQRFCESLAVEVSSVGTRLDAHKQKGRREAGLFFGKLASESDQYFDQYLATIGPPKV